MANTFGVTGGTAHSTAVTGLTDGSNYTYYVRCQDGAGNANPDDFVIAFTVTSSGATTSSFTGVEIPLSEGGMWDSPGAWGDLRKNNGAYAVDLLDGGRLVTPTLGANQYSEITYDQDPGTAAWPGVMTRVQSAGNGSGYLAIAYNGQVQLYRTDDSGSLNFTLLAAANATLGTAPRRLRLESQGSTHKVYFNGVQLITFSETRYTSGQVGITAAIFGGPTVKILTFAGGNLTGGDQAPPVRSNGQPTGSLALGTTQTSLSLATNEAATCRYSITAGVAFGSMPNIFSVTGGVAHSTTVTGLTDGGNYTYYVRCQDAAGNANPDDFPISFSVSRPSDTTPPVRSNGQPTGSLASGTTQTSLSLSTNESATCRYSITAGVAFGSMPNIFSVTGGVAHSTTVTGLTDGSNYTYYIRCQDTSGNANPDDFAISFSVLRASDTTPPVRSNGQPAGSLAAGTTQTSLTLSTNEAATCRYATTAGVAYASMTNTFGTTGGTAHSTTVTGLTNGSNYNYYVRCKDVAGNANPDDFLIAFSVANPGAVTSNFSGVESPLSEGGMWDSPGSWGDLRKSNGAYAVDQLDGGRLVSPTLTANQYSEITYDQDPGSSAWVGVMTRVQSSTNGSGYLAIAYAGQVRLYRTDDSGSLTFTLLATANVSVGTAPRRLRLESRSTNHKVYFNGVQVINFTQTRYTTGQVGVAASIFGGPTVKILTFAGGGL